jgi:hypothetical protein
VPFSPRFRRFLAAATVLIIVTAFLLAFGPGIIPTKVVEVKVEKPEPETTINRVPDTSRVVPVIGIDGMSHACPVAPHSMLTNLHVVYNKDLRDTTLMSFSQFGRAGILMPYRTSNFADIASVVGTFDVTPYPIAAQPPLPGDRIWWVGYDWKSQGDAFAPAINTALVTRIVAGHVVADTPPVEGSSGSCLLNARGEVVGIVAWRVPIDGGARVLVGPGIWTGALTLELLDQSQEFAAQFRAAQ